MAGQVPFVHNDFIYIERRLRQDFVGFFSDVQEHALKQQIHYIRKTLAGKTILPERKRQYLDYVIERFRKAKIEYGENVGILMANSITQGIFQMSLDTFKQAGSGQNAGSNIAAMKEILNVLNSRQFPMLNIHFKEPITYEDALRSREFFEVLTLRDLLINREKDVYKYEELPNRDWYQLFAFLHQRPLPEGKTCVRFELNGYLLWSHKLTVPQLVRLLLKNSADAGRELDIWYTVTEPIYVDVYQTALTSLDKDEISNEKIYMANVMTELLLSQRLKGVSDIKRVHPYVIPFIGDVEHEVLLGNWILLPKRTPTNDELQLLVDRLLVHGVTIEYKTEALLLVTFTKKLSVFSELDPTLRELLTLYTVRPNINRWQVFINETLYANHSIGFNDLARFAKRLGIILTKGPYADTVYAWVQPPGAIRREVIEGRPVFRVRREYFAGQLEGHTLLFGESDGRYALYRTLDTSLFGDLSHVVTQYGILAKGGLQLEAETVGVYVYPGVYRPLPQQTDSENELLIEWMATPLQLMRAASIFPWSKYVYVQTDGGKMADLTMIKIIDHNKSYGNNFTEIFKFLGIGALRSFIMLDVNQTYLRASSRSIDPRQIALAASFMTSRGAPTPFTHIAIKTADVDVITKAATSESFKNFATAAISSKNDPLMSIASHIFVGERPKFGTHAFDVVYSRESAPQQALEYKVALSKAQERMLIDATDIDGYVDPPKKLIEITSVSQDIRVDMVEWPSIKPNIIRIKMLRLPPIEVDGVLIRDIDLRGGTTPFVSNNYVIPTPIDVQFLVALGTLASLPEIPKMKIPKWLRADVKPPVTIRGLLPRPPRAAKQPSPLMRIKLNIADPPPAARDIEYKDVAQATALLQGIEKIVLK